MIPRSCRSSHPIAAVLAALLTLVLILSLPATAQDSIAETQTSGLSGVTDAPETGFGNGSVIVAPIPFSNPMIGSGLILGAGYLFKTDAGSKPSVLGIGALRSNNGSSAYGASVQLAFDQNRWLVDVSLAQADLNYDLIFGNRIIPLTQTGTLSRLELSYGVTPELSFGGVARYLDTTVGAASAAFPGLPPALLPAADLTILSLGAVARWDTRDDTIYPTSGHRLQAIGEYAQILEGASNDYAKAYATFDLYRKLGASGVIAMRAAICGASQEAPFFDQCSDRKSVV